MEDAVTDLEREYKRGERLLKEYDRKLDDLEEEREWFEEDGWDTAPVDEFIAHIEEDSAAVEAVLSRFDVVSTDMADALAEAEDAYNEATEETVNGVWLIINKAQLVNHELELNRTELSYYDTVRGFYDWNLEAARIESDFATMGQEMSEELTDAIVEAGAIQEEYYAAAEIYWDLVDEVADVIATIPDYSMSDLGDEDYKNELWDLYDDFWDARQDMQWAQEDMWYITDDLWDMWEVFQEAYEQINFGNEMQWIMEDIAWVREDISLVSEVFEMLQGKVEDDSVLADIEEVLHVVDKATVMLDEMEEMAANLEDPEDMEDLWEDMEALGEYVDPRMENVLDYLEDHQDELNLSEDEEALVEEFLAFEEEEDGRGGNDRLEQAYNSNVAASLEGYLSEDQINDLIAMITSSVMESLSQYIDSDLAGEIVEKLMANLDNFKADKFGEGFADELASNGNIVFEQMDAVDPEDLSGDLEDLYDEFKTAPMPEQELAQESADYWGEVALTMSASPSEDEIEALIQEGEALLEEVQLSEYENQLAFKDVPGYFDDDFETVWFAEAVTEGNGVYWDGRKDENGDLTYEYDPTGTTLRAEALKIVLSAFGYDEGAGGSDWWSGWEKTGEGLGLTLVNEDLSQTISREETFRLIFEVADMSGGSFEGSFSDVDVLDDYAPVEALYEAGIVTGDGATGDARLEGTLNRAEMAALVQRVVDWAGEQEFLEGDLVSYGESDFQLDEFLARIESFLRSVLPTNLFR